MNIWLFAGLCAVIVFAFWMFASWALNLLANASQAHAIERVEARRQRKEMQWKIRWCINLMVADDDNDDLEWLLHSLLYEYRQT